jgi:hypothetical protein
VKLPALIGGLRQEGIKKIYIDGIATGGTFRITHGVETTAPLNVLTATPAQVKAELEALAAIAYNDVQVSREAKTNEVQTIQMKGGPTGGQWYVQLDSHRTPGIPWNAGTFELYDALSELPSLGWRDIGIEEKSTNEVQLVYVNGEPRGGTFTLTFDGTDTTVPLPHRASAIQVYNALVNLPKLAIGDFTVTKSLRTPWEPYRITFTGKYRGCGLQPITGDASGLTGGAGCTITAERETEGGRLFTVRFQGAQAGVNLPQMESPINHLTGGLNPGPEFTTVSEGSRPWVIKFVNNLSGAKLPEMTVDVSGVTGNSIRGRVVTVVESLTFPSENATVDTDPRVEQILSESGSPLWSRMNGVRFVNPIPPYTKSCAFKITVSGTPPGQMVTLRLPRPWSRPWGLR